MGKPHSVPQAPLRRPDNVEMTPSTEFESRLSAGQWWALVASAILAIVAPTLIAAHDPPSITFYNQVLAVCGWGLFTLVLTRTHSAMPSMPASPKHWGRTAFLSVAGVVVINAAAAIYSTVWGDLPAGLAMMGSGMCLVALLVAWAGWYTGRLMDRDAIFDLFAAALCLAGTLGMALGLIQVFHPQWADGYFIAEPTMAGRAVGNLRQPNHFSTLLVWASASAIWLGARKRLPAPLAAALMALFIWGIVLTASRTGMVAMAFLALWGLLDKRLPRVMRAALLAAPVLYGLFWGGMWMLAHADKSVTFAAESRLHDHSDISSSRFKIWANVLDLIKQHPWTGVGYGEFNLAWTLTSFPSRPVAFFDHTHNLIFQWAVELGLPLTVLLVLLTATAGIVLIWRQDASRVTPAGASAVIVSTAMLHSLLEYPLWYSYFLLPTAFAWGAGLAARATDNTQSSTPAGPAWGHQTWLAAGGALTMLGAVWCALDFQAAANIYAPRAGAGPLDQRIEFGQKMAWFGYQADYAFVTVPDDDEPTKPPMAFRRTLHNLLDARLMIAYAKSLNAAGETDKARFVVAQLKEFKNPMEKAFLKPCTEPKVPGQISTEPFQCQPPSRSYRWQELLPD